MISVLHALQAIVTVLALGGVLIVVWGLICQWAEKLLQTWAEVRDDIAAVDDEIEQERAIRDNEL